MLAEITSTVTNEGDKWAEGVVVRAYNGDPLDGGVQLGEDLYFDIVYPKESKTVRFSWDTSGYTGTNNIYVVADPLDTVKESNEVDNTVLITAVITAPLKPAPTVKGSGIALSQQIVNEGDTVTLSATIKNRGSDVSNIPVSLYLGDPENGGSLLEYTLITQIIPLNGDVTIDFAFSTSGFMDNNSLYVVIDHENIIDELIEGNNTAVKQLQVNRKRLFLDVTTDASLYQTNSDAGIIVFIKNEGTLPWTGTGNIYIEDPSGNHVADVAVFTVDDLKPLGFEGWDYRVPVTVTETGEMKDAIAITYMNFNDLFSFLGIAGRTIDVNSIRVSEFDGLGNFIGEKKARFDKDNGFDIVTNPSGRVLWLIDGTTPADNTRYFYLYFDTTENGPKPPSVNTGLPEKGRLIAFFDAGDFYTVTGNGDGTFGNEVLVDIMASSRVNGIVLEDFNKDGFPDIISGDSYGDIYYYQNKADGSDTFLPKEVIGHIVPSTTSYNYLQAITSGDYNNDGNHDFILSLSYSDLYIFSGNGDGTFNQSKMTDNANVYFRGKASADFDKDGNIDFVVSDSLGAVFIYYGYGDGTFENPVEIGEIGTDSYGVTAADFDNNGYTDIIANDGFDGNGYIFRGLGVRDFKYAENVPSIKTSQNTAYDAADFNGDGNQDLIAAQLLPGKLYYSEGNGDGTFKLPVTIPVTSYYARAVSVAGISPEVIAETGTPEKIESTLYQFIWNTGTTLPGDYKVHVTLSEGQVLITGDYASFEILPDINLDSSVVTDRIEYEPNEYAAITSTITSLSQNTILEDLEATVSIVNGSGAVLYIEAYPVPIMVPGQLKQFTTYWNTSTNPPGDYPVTLEVRDSSGAVISASAATLTISSEIDPSALLVGQISVDQQSLLQGENVNIYYSVTNVGNIDLSQVNLSIPVVHVVELTPYDTLSDQTPLLMGDTYGSTQSLGTGSYTAKDYLVVLQAEIAGVEETLASTYIRVEGAPSAPSLYWPIHGEDVETLMPELIVNNASDPNDDDLTYEFELYSDSSLSNLIASSDEVDEGDGTTSWPVPFELEENASYFWRARAYDGILYGDWMTPAGFRVNVENDAPTAPTLSSPADGSEAATVTPMLIVNNAFDPDSEELIYNFEVALDTDFTNIVSSESGIAEGAGTTSWQIPVNLEENTTYFWRVQADDWLIEGPWMETASFFVNTANDAPTAPSIIEPVDGSEIPGLNADIIATGATDPDLDPLLYLFETDSAVTFDSLEFMTSGYLPETPGQTIWSAAGLSDNTTYFARVIANDTLIDSPWSATISFFVNTINDTPTTPILSNPSDGGAVNVFTPELSVYNSSDLDNDTLTYDFEIYEDVAMTSLITSVAALTEMPQITSWTIPVNLTENETYYWRARAFDSDVYSGWMSLASFMVNTANDSPSAPALHAPAEGSSLDLLTPTLEVTNALDPDNDILTYDFEIYADSVLVQSVTEGPEDPAGITSVTLDEALSDDTVYTWRARAYDGDRYGAWMDMASFSIHLPVDSITATIDFRPRTLNKNSHGRWVVVFIELPEGYDVRDIDRSSILLEGSIPARPFPYRIGDRDWDGIKDLMVKFRRSDVIDILPVGDEVPVMVSGTVGTTAFEGMDTIRVIENYKWRHRPPLKRCKSNHFWERKRRH